MDRLISSWQKIGDSVDSYTYYSYDDMGRAYRSDFRLMGTAGGTLTQSYEHTYDALDGSLERIDVNASGITQERLLYLYDTLKRLNRKTLSRGVEYLDYYYNYKPLENGRKSNLVSEYSVYLNYGMTHLLAYTYDAVGNITKITNNGSTVAEYTYDEQNQLTIF